MRSTRRRPPSRTLSTKGSSLTVPAGAIRPVILDFCGGAMSRILNSLRDGVGFDLVLVGAAHQHKVAPDAVAQAVEYPGHRASTEIQNYRPDCSGRYSQGGTLS